MQACRLMNSIVTSLLVTTCLGLELASAELTLASPFTDNAVLQRDVTVPVWGVADPGAKIIVEFSGQKKKSTADANGRWEVSLDPLAATAKPRVLSVRSSNEKQQLAIENVVVGEVWICSGQSNMQMQVGRVPEVKALIPKAKNLRSFAVKRTVAFTAQDSCQGRWVERHPDSAVALAFAYYLEAMAEVPVGIILTCWGSSSLEAWMPRDMTATVPHFKTIMKEFDADAETRQRILSLIHI